jgi:uncharacterized protein YdeI (YjbR/CyaY-like superfamily)
MDKKLKSDVLLKADLQIMSFELPKEWQYWLEQNHNSSKGIWIRFFKKASGTQTISYAEALDEALCFGWIDGQSKSYGEESYIQKFTPRRPKSIWSKRNIEHIARLEKEGRMRAAGLREAEAAKSDGRWEQAYDSPSNLTMPEDFLNELSKNKEAFTFFEGLNRANKYAIGWRLQTAKKAETREKRMRAILEMLSRGEKFH